MMLHISNHAIFRYLQRVVGIPVETIKKIGITKQVRAKYENEILTKEEREQFDSYQGCMTIRGAELRIDDCTVVTCGKANVHSFNSGDGSNWIAPKEMFIPSHIDTKERRKTHKKRNRL